MKGRYITLLVGLAVSAITLWYALKGVDLAHMVTLLRQVEPRWLVALLLAYSLQFILKAHRWRLILLPLQKIPVRRLWPPLIIGFFINNILPARLGEFVRVYAGSRYLRLPISPLLASLVLERLLDLLAVVMILGLALSLGGVLPPLVVQAGYLILGLAITGVLFVYLLASRTDALLGLLRRPLRVLPESLREQLHQQLQLGAAGLHAVTRPRLLAGLLLSSLLQWLLAGLAMWCAFYSLAMELPLSAALVTLGVTVFAVSLPSSPGFFGPVQLAFVLALRPYGVDEASAVAASIVFHLLTWVYVNLFGIHALHRVGMRWGEIEADAELVRRQGGLSGAVEGGEKGPDRG